MDRVVFLTRVVCMTDWKCTKFYLKPFSLVTKVDGLGYPIYMRLDDGRVFSKKGIECDNGFVVPYNKKFSLRYHAQINIEWCIQFRYITYRFNYFNKGPDYFRTYVILLYYNG